MGLVRRVRPHVRLHIPLVLLLSLVAAVGAALWVLYALNRPGSLEASTSLVIPRGTGTKGIADMLGEKNIIADPVIFILMAKTKYRDHPLHAGEYAFAPHVTLKQVIEALAEGKTVLRRVTIPEGLTSAEILELLKDTEGLTGQLPALESESDYTNVVRDAVYGVPVVKEGELLPDTYLFSYGDEYITIINRMREAQAKLIEELWPNRAPNLPFLTQEEAMTLASIVEKETGLKDERGLVASVYINRLRQGMKLQADPTVIYGIAKGTEDWVQPLKRAHLSYDSPFNTYMYQGLPPGPIANPGAAAIRAALKPAETNYLYFVSDTKGGHFFARTLNEHNANVQRYRLLLERGD